MGILARAGFLCSETNSRRGFFPVAFPVHPWEYGPWMCPQWREHYAKAAENEVRGSEGVQGATDSLAREEGRGGGHAAWQTNCPGRTGHERVPREPTSGDRHGSEGGGGLEGGRSEEHTSALSSRLTHVSRLL